MSVRPHSQANSHAHPFRQYFACEHCDTLYRRPRLSGHEVARCDVCGAVLLRANRLTLDAWLALTVAAAITFLIANFRPVVSINFQGAHNESTVWGAIIALAQRPTAPIAVPMALTLIIVPLLQISALLWVLGHARAGQRPPAFELLMRMLVGLRPWSMVEVCLLGILVSMIKLSDVVSVTLGAGTWAMAVLTILIAVIASRDMHWLWDLVDEPDLARQEGLSDEGVAIETRHG
ncbi:paraquat-inducible protein A [Roseateles sp. SL47]|uniref:paraquat-inducible protein A n=1 Tax=Roseateles sp. SL47 TaxID=2995138 RepID=UPI00226E9331|nr:paraquat-inducible protein A [Roseateles sp. SL47]WAC72325.1 paraquat-inducible protein A [Roseateles sp. SL47]